MELLLSHTGAAIVRAGLFGLLCAMILGCQIKAKAQDINQAYYAYPYQDPLLATSTLAIMQSHGNDPFVQVRDLEINVLDDRDNRYLLAGMGKVHYRFYQQTGLAPLVFIIPGMGSTAYTGSANYLAELFAEYGFHVLLMPSVFNWRFALAASRSGLPGYIQDDAQDLYHVMQLTLNAVQAQCQAKIGKIGLLGLSEGAREAGFIGQLDNSQNRIGINTYLLINPPVDLLTAVRKIDTMAGQGKAASTDYKNNLIGYARGVVEDSLHLDPNSPLYFTDWDKRLQLSDRQLSYLIGGELQKAVDEVIYVSSLAFDLGVLKTPISWGNRSARLDEARSYNVMAYLEKFLIPKIRQQDDKGLTIEKLGTQSSLKAIKTTLKNNKRMFLMHNQDDFLIDTEGLIFLQDVFGERAKFYPHGGHLGNLWYADNKKHILTIFLSLFEGRIDPKTLAQD